MRDMTKKRLPAYRNGVENMSRQKDQKREDSCNHPSEKAGDEKA